MFVKLQYLCMVVFKAEIVDEKLSIIVGLTTFSVLDKVFWVVSMASQVVC